MLYKYSERHERAVYGLARYPKPPRYQAAPRPDPFFIRIKYSFDKGDVLFSEIFFYFGFVTLVFDLQIRDECAVYRLQKTCNLHK